jgi:hypothetical protein
MLDYMTQDPRNVLLGFFLCSQSDDHPYKDLTKSGYTLNMKQKSSINLLYFYLLTENQMYKSGNFYSFW